MKLSNPRLALALLALTGLADPALASDPPAWNRALIGARFVESCNERGVAVVSVDEIALFDQRPEHRGLDFGRRVDLRELSGLLDSGEVEPTGIVHMGACSDTTEMDLDFDGKRDLDRRLTDRLCDRKEGRSISACPQELGPAVVWQVRLGVFRDSAHRIHRFDRISADSGFT